MSRVRLPVWCPGVSVAALLAVLPFLGSVQGYFTGDLFGLVRLFSNAQPLHFLALVAAPWTDGIYGHTADELRPTVALTYQFDSQWGATNPLPYHLTTIAIHLVNTIVVWVMAHRLAGLTLGASTLSASVFAVLPIQASAVAYIDGRADSLPALFYLGGVLAYGLWRQKGAMRLYACAIVFCLFALWSKQSAVMFVPTILAYDFLVAGRFPRLTSNHLRVYLPFVVLTAAYLALRVTLFGSALREDQISISTFEALGMLQFVHLKLLLVGPGLFDTFDTSEWHAMVAWVVSAAALVWLGVLTISVARTPRNGKRLAACYFGPVWWVLTIAPLAVTYVIPRHLYLTSAGAAIAVGVLADWSWALSGKRWRVAIVVGAAVLIGAYTVALEAEIGRWDNASAISERMVRDVQNLVAVSSPGTLILLADPVRNADTGRHRGGLDVAPVTVWAWVMPFVVEPPFSPRVGQHVYIVSPPDTYCCPAQQWFVDSHRTLDVWLNRETAPVVIALVWDRSASTASERGTANFPSLKLRVTELAHATTPDIMAQAFKQLAKDLCQACDV